MIWNQIVAMPSTWIALTLFAYVLCDALYLRSRCLPVLNPVLLSVALIIVLLNTLNVSYLTYFSGGMFIHLMLAPATVALAIPLYANLQRIREYFWPLLIALLVGATLGVVSALLIGYALGLSSVALISISPKSVTTPIAMALSQHAGGNVPLTAGVVLLTGTFGAMIAAPLFRYLKINDEVAQGFAMGIAAHGIGTSRALQVSETAGAFAGLAMGLNGVLTSLILSFLLQLWAHWF